jgi:hypothetical protein
MDRPWTEIAIVVTFKNGLKNSLTWAKIILFSEMLKNSKTTVQNEDKAHKP